MLEIKVYRDIAQNSFFFSLLGGEGMAFSLETVKEIFDKNKDEKDVMFNIHCDGGSVTEGLAIYDFIRTSGRNIYTNIDGGCHSMAVCLLLAAPFENRSANPNARALIHEVRVMPYDAMTAEELRAEADNIDREQKAILNIYADRTGQDIADLEVMMKREQVWTAQDLKDFGFISKINSYTTNKMSKSITNFKNKLKNLLGGEAKNWSHTDKDGNTFGTPSETSELSVGMSASPDGTYQMEDGRTIVISEGVISEIIEPSSSTDLAAENELLKNAIEETIPVIEAIEAENSALTTENAELKNKVAEMEKTINSFKASNYNPKGRTAAIPAKNNEAKNNADFIERIKKAANILKTKGGKK